MTQGGAAPGPGTASGRSGRDDRSELGAGQRAAALSRMAAETFDVIVVGGGVTGCGIALDAASRGLSVALAEMDDYASGTSSRSGKLIHGGLRYLEQLNFGLVREALRERDLMLRHLCPHLVKPVRFIYPLSHRVWERGYVGAGVALYDAFGGAKAVPHHRHLTRRGALDVAPALHGAHLAGAITFFDAQVDDARHTLTLARTAAAHGAVLASSAKVTGLLRTGDQVSGVRLRDMETGAELTVRGRHVIGAAGAWTGEIQQMLPEHDGFQVRASKGVHILVPRERIRSKAAILVRAEDSVLFIRPWGRHWLIGTTDTPWDADPSSPVAAPADIAYLLRNVNRVVSPPITVDDITGVFAGLRPLLSGGPGATSRLTREHAVASPAPGLTVIGGGKYTTYRVMARDAVDAALGAAGTEKLRPVPPSGTEDIALLGADGYPELWNSRHRLAERAGLPGDRIERLLNRYGSRTGDLLAAIERQPSLADPIPGAEDYLKAEARYAVSHEGALHLDDILARRLHAASEQPDGGVRAAECVAPLAGEVLGWSGATVTAEIERYRTWVTAERAAMRGGADAGAVRR